MTIAENIQHVQDKIAAACARVGRSPDEITVVAVSKRKPVSDVIAALEAGVHHFGENRIEEAEEKLPAIAAALGSLPKPHWHFVGHIQSRKTKDVLPLFPTIHSLDSVKLAEKIARIVDETGHSPAVYIQVNVSGEAQKYGFEGYNWEKDPQVKASLYRELEQVLSIGALNVRGLMTMAPYGAPDDELRAVFASLAALKQAIANHFGVTLLDLSMGMTDDYEIAIEEGATVIRIGRALFGERQY